MGDEDNRASVLTLPGLNHLENLILDDNVESSSGFVGDQYLGIQQHG
ncbi:MAG TPA: hypothetical protein VGG32_03405 [Thermoplasmata archaeon]